MKTMNLNLNTFDAEGNVVDTSCMALPENQVSDIVDHAAQLLVVLQDMAGGECGIDAFDQVLSELDDALVNAGVINAKPLACLGLLSQQKRA